VNSVANLAFAVDKKMYIDIIKEVLWNIMFQSIHFFEHYEWTEFALADRSKPISLQNIQRAFMKSIYTS